MLLLAASFLWIQYLDVFCLSVAWPGRWWPSACSSSSWGLHVCKVTFVVLHATPTCQALAPGARRRIDFDQACMLQRAFRRSKLLHHIEVLAIFHFWKGFFTKNLLLWPSCFWIWYPFLQGCSSTEEWAWTLMRPGTIYGCLQDLLVQEGYLLWMLSSARRDRLMSKAGITASSQDFPGWDMLRSWKAKSTRFQCHLAVGHLWLAVNVRCKRSSSASWQSV